MSSIQTIRTKDHQNQQPFEALRRPFYAIYDKIPVNIFQIPQKILKWPEPKKPPPPTPPRDVQPDFKRV